MLQKLREIVRVEGVSGAYNSKHCVRLSTRSAPVVTRRACPLCGSPELPRSEVGRLHNPITLGGFPWSSRGPAQLRGYIGGGFERDD
jgi:hypothetical protein